MSLLRKIGFGLLAVVALFASTNLYVYMSTPRSIQDVPIIVRDAYETRKISNVSASNITYCREYFSRSYRVGYPTGIAPFVSKYSMHGDLIGEEQKSDLVTNTRGRGQLMLALLGIASGLFQCKEIATK
ncbi:hypothetical protein A3D71_02895 [Candidatus Kaiserbacteria bacterium RIFCSPHIGHO2_02_FULL_55_20]|uniref:Uncharacterized protein n=1 Tax=Candidatus Kaiserbacteria bacterium RIFCSPHIGHO2_02_FULL_55_20 TaxID=1798497 RepID=A0A1F6DW74_9BACT|nr:MAG: hypothetical protein A2680_01270 [Candidatus Kaiserbacteria bacterium RIFCSPHIGHO2_01_FULL_55_37]OGG65636.1 MAG: hypothetical protein A3D71_02895 [Candidatus Kaiserbacteria bacterium RIFCSPHIGHO2_02_FULL_55_20]